MTYPTAADIELRVRQELGLIDEPGVTSTEIYSWQNQGIDLAEALVHTLYEDYFLTYGSLSLVQGTQEYALPSDIYAGKLRGIIYSNGSIVYPVKRIYGRDVFEIMKRSEIFGANEEYRYIMVNVSAAAGQKIRLFPASRETLAGALTCWYLRNANRVATGTDPIDIPEWSSFIVAYVKWQIALNKPGLGDPTVLNSEQEIQKQMMIETLTSKQPDDQTQVPMDTDIYEEHT